VEFIKQNIWPILFIINYAIAISAIVIILLKNKNPTKTVSYILVLAIFPFFGPVVYYLFGQQYRKTKIFDRKHVANSEVVKTFEERLKFDGSDYSQVKELLNGKVQIVNLLKENHNALLSQNNEVDIIRNGENKFKRLFKELRSAKKYIHLEYYVLEDGETGTELIEIICEKAKEGLEVLLTYDDVGSRISRSLKQKLSNSGVKHQPFMPVLFSSLTGKSNYRNHRKIAIIDGEIGYVGGINVSDEYVNGVGNKNPYWRDTHLRLCGQAVKALQFHFLTTWDFVTEDKVEVKSEYFDDFECEGKVPVQITASGPDTDWPNIMEAILTAINNATDYVYITTPYFIPNDQIISALQIASKIGLDVRIIIPEVSDSWIAEHATFSFLEPLLEANVKVYLYKKGFIHAKTMAVDDIFSSVGTCNLDNRSFNINFEINALIYNEEKTKELKAHFEEDLKDCEELDLERWKERSKWCKLQESVARLGAPLL